MIARLRNKELIIGKFLPNTKYKEAIQFYSLEVLPRKRPMKTILVTNKELNTANKRVIIVLEN